MARGKTISVEWHFLPVCSPIDGRRTLRRPFVTFFGLRDVFHGAPGLPRLRYPGTLRPSLARRRHALARTRKALLLSYQQPSPRPTFAALLDSFAQGHHLPFAESLTEHTIQQACRDHGVAFAGGADDVWTPALPLRAFLTPCLSAATSCVAAVARALARRAALGLPLCSAATGAYCKARAKLPGAFLRQLALRVGDATADQAPDAWRWRGRRVLLADGTEVSLPDTVANQHDYPQPLTQKPGLGFPSLRLVALLTFATAVPTGAALGPGRGDDTGATALCRELLGRLRPADVVVADRYYCSWWLVALVSGRGADVAFRMQQLRHCDFRRGRRLGRGDQVVCWPRPQRPDWMDAVSYERLPKELRVREVRVAVARPGYRVRQLVVAAALTDGAAYPQESLAQLYHYRWHVELDLRNRKQTLRMDVLSCKSPAMVRKEVWAHLLGYHLIRAVLARSALARGKSPRRLSFAGAVQTWQAYRGWLLCGGGVGGESVVASLLSALASHEVGSRPGRVEPRAVKRRRKARLLTKPREQRRAELLAGKES